jgi:hypothetical protein
VRNILQMYPTEGRSRRRFSPRYKTAISNALTARCSVHGIEQGPRLRLANRVTENGARMKCKTFVRNKEVLNCVYCQLQKKLL